MTFVTLRRGVVALCVLGLALTGSASAASAATSWTTFHGSNQRQGVNTGDSNLSP